MTHRSMTDYDLIPHIACTGRSTRVAIRPMGTHAAFKVTTTYLVRILPLESSLEPNEQGGEAYPSVTLVPDETGRLIFQHVFEGEQPHVLRIFQRPDLASPVAELTMYSLQPDLYALRPFRGDLHVHTNRSDGCESPAIVAAHYRAAGFDFLAITDHGQRKPSLEAIETVGTMPTGLVVLPGEEVHAPDNHLHIVQVGGEPGLAEVFAKESERYRAETAELRERLASGLPDGVDPVEFASCAWCAREIRAQGGIGILPHPYWRSDMFHAPLAMALHLLRSELFDAFEGLGGLDDPIENHLQISLYHQIRSEGRYLPIVGCSDSHGTVGGSWFDWSATLVFSTNPTLDGVRQAIRDSLCVAVESYPGQSVRAHGPFRLVRYAQFLIEHYLPGHREFCHEEGRLLKALICGDETVRESLGLAAQRTAAYRERFFGGGQST